MSTQVSPETLALPLRALPWTDIGLQRFDVARAIDVRAEDGSSLHLKFGDRIWIGSAMGAEAGARFLALDNRSSDDPRRDRHYVVSRSQIGAIPVLVTKPVSMATRRRVVILEGNSTIFEALADAARLHADVVNVRGLESAMVLATTSADIALFVIGSLPDHERMSQEMARLIEEMRTQNPQVTVIAVGGSRENRDALMGLGCQISTSAAQAVTFVHQFFN